MLELKPELKQEFLKRVEGICFAAKWKDIPLQPDINLKCSPISETNKNKEKEEVFKNFIYNS